MSNYRGGKAGDYAWTGDPLYDKGIYHATASSQQNPACVVEPGIPEDVGKIVGSFCLRRLAFTAALTKTHHRF